MQPGIQNRISGIDGRTDTELPEWYRRNESVEKSKSIAEAIRDLPQAAENHGGLPVSLHGRVDRSGTAPTRHGVRSSAELKLT
jgi:hypothetical protein